jgi:hypothetical protein
MSKTLKAIARHTALPSKPEIIRPSPPKVIVVWQQAGPTTFFGYALTKPRFGLCASAINQTRNG